MRDYLQKKSSQDGLEKIYVRPFRIQKMNI